MEVAAGAAASSLATAAPSVSPRRYNGRTHSPAAVSDAASATGATATSSPIAAATVARISSPSLQCGLPSCFDPLLFLYERRGMAFPRIRLLSDPATDLPAPYAHLLHHRANMTPTLSRFWCDQHVALRVIEKVEQREPTAKAPHGVLQRWIALQVEQPTHVPFKQSAQMESAATQQNGPPSTPAAAARPAATPQSTPHPPGNGVAPPHSRSSSTSSTSSSCSTSSTTTASNSLSVSAQKSSRRTHSATKLPPKRGPKPGRLYYQDSVQKIESGPSTPRETHARDQSEEALDSADAAGAAATVAAVAAAPAPAVPAPAPVSSSSPHLVEFGSIRIHLGALPESLRPAIWAGEKPFATLLLTATPQPIAQHIRPQAFFEIEWGEDLEALTGTVPDARTSLSTPPTLVYGRCNHIYSDVDEKQLICEVVEILPPMPHNTHE